MYYLKCNKELFSNFSVSKNNIDIIGKLQTVNIDNFELYDNEIILVWDKLFENNIPLPNIIVVNDDKIKDFFAWTLTYFRSIRPISGYIRILPKSLAHLINDVNLIKKTDEFNSIFLGAILGEAYAYSVGKIDLNRFNYRIFARTLSFSFSNSLNYYKIYDLLNKNYLYSIEANWKILRDITNQSPLRVSSSSVAKIWEIILNSFCDKWLNDRYDHYDKLILKSIDVIKKTGRISSDIWYGFDFIHSNDVFYLSSMEGPLEERVKVAQNAICELAKGIDETKNIRAFLAGYIVNLIQPGSFNYFQLLNPLNAVLGESYIWYGIISGMKKENNLFGFENSFARLLNREINRIHSCFESPTCDISLQELNILLKSRKDFNINIHNMANTILTVEIFPMISSSVNWLPSYDDRDSIKSSIYNKQLSLVDINTNRGDILEVLEKINQGNYILDDIRKLVEKKFGEKVPKKRRK